MPRANATMDTNRRPNASTPRIVITMWAIDACAHPSDYVETAATGVAVTQHALCKHSYDTGWRPEISTTPSTYIPCRSLILMLRSISKQLHAPAIATVGCCIVCHRTHLYDGDLHLLLGCSVAVPHYCQHTAQLQIALHIADHSRCSSNQQKMDNEHNMTCAASAYRSTMTRE